MYQMIASSRRFLSSVGSSGWSAPSCALKFVIASGKPSTMSALGVRIDRLKYASHFSSLSEALRVKPGSNGLENFTSDLYKFSQVGPVFGFPSTVWQLVQP